MKSPFVFLLVLVITIFTGFVTSEKCNPADKKVLFKIKQSLGNPYHLASWTADSDCCEWYCVKCHLKTNRINSLTIFSGNISGQIPAAVGDLPYLEMLEFRKLTNLTGTIPPTIAKLQRLQYLFLSYTDLSGPVPAFLGKLKKLTFLDLSHNKMTGSLPASLAGMSKLTELDVSYNQLCGKIPVGGKLQSIDATKYAKNKCLCGAPLPACK